MMSDIFLYSGDDAVLMSELHCYHVDVRQCNSVPSGEQLGCQLGHHWHLLLNVV